MHLQAQRPESTGIREPSHGGEAASVREHLRQWSQGKVMQVSFIK
jgi:hypothetical protein